MKIIRSMLWGSSLVALAAAQTGTPDKTADKTPDAITSRGQYFELIYHGGDDDLAKQALAVVEPVWPLVCAAFGVTEHELAEPLRVHLYRTTAGYLLADQRLTGGRFGPNQAMSDWRSKSAHVAMQPPVRDEFLREFGLPMQTQAMLAWEACHIARFELCANFPSHPGWFHDGLAAATARRVMEQLYPQLGEQPFFTQRWLRVRDLLQGEKLPKVRDLLADETGELAMRDRYAVRVAFYDFAQSSRHRPKLVEVAKKIRSTGAGTSYQRRVLAIASEALGRLDRLFVATVGQQDPRWNEATRSLWCFGEQWRQLAFADTNTVAFSRRPVIGGAFVAKGELRILPADGRQMNFLFARTDEGFYSLAFNAGSGITLFDHRVQGNQWRRVGSGNEPGLQVGVAVAFAVRGEGKELEVELAGHSWQFELPRPLPDKIVWGIGAQAGGHGAATGSAGIWRGLTVTAH